MADPRKTLAPIKKLLLARDEDSVRQGVELLRALDDPSLFDALLTGVRCTLEDAKSGRALVTSALVVEGFCAGAAQTGRWDRIVALALLAAAPPESRVAAEFIASCKSLSVDRDGDYRHSFSVDLEPLAALVNLERLVVRSGLAPRNLAALTRLPRLRALELQGAVSDIAALSGAPSLESLTVSSAALVTPGPLRDVPSLRALSLEGCYQLASLDVLRGLDALERLSVSLHAFHGDPSPLSGLRALKSVRVHNGSASFTSVEPLAACAALEEVALESCGSLTTLAPLRALRNLRRLTLEGCGKLERLDLDGITTLEHFLARWVALTEVDCLAGCALESASVEWVANLERLDGLRGATTLRTLHLSTQSLTSLSGIEGCAELESLSLRSAKSLTSLRALSGAKRLKELRLPACASLTSLDGLEGCASLTHLVVEGGLFDDLSPLAGLVSLEQLSLRGCAKVTDLAPLASLPKLRALVLAGTGVDRSKVPAHLKHVSSFAQDADLAKLAAKPPPEARGPVIPTTIGAGHRKAWTQIKKLLLTRDPETIDQGVELVRALDDAAIYAELLRDVSWTGPDRRHPLGRIKLDGTWFEDSEPARPFRVRAVLALAAAAPADCEPANALKAGMKMLSFHGGADPKRACPFDAAPLVAFRGLATLDVTAVPKLEHSERLAELTALTSLAVRRMGGWSGVDFSKMTSLRQLTLHGASLASLSSLREAPGLEALQLSQVQGSGALSLEGHPTLQVFALTDAPEIREVSLRGCAALKRVDLQRLSSLTALDLRECAAVITLTLYGDRALAEVRGLAELHALQTLTATYGSTAWLPAAPLDGLSRLHALDLSGSSLTELSRVANLPAARSLTLDGAGELADLSALARMTSLSSLSLRWCSKVTDLMPLAGLSLHSLRANGTKAPPDRVPLALKRFVK